MLIEFREILVLTLIVAATTATSKIDSIAFVDVQDIPIECGKIQTSGEPFIRFGQKAKKGEWPWHAALYLKIDNKEIYVCGGTLVSRFHVITAAHCVTEGPTTKLRDLDTFLVYLGLHNLKNRLTEATKYELSEVKVHPEYTPNPYKNDIAVLTVQTYVELTEHVWPICMWTEDKDIAKYTNETGTVVGWGFDENGSITDTLMQTSLPIIPFEKCLQSDRGYFAQYENQKSYCAGYKNGTSICNGDSGGGMFLTSRSADSPVWQLRGIVSAGTYVPGTQVCHASHYVLFTDVAKYQDWIKETTKN